MSEIPIWNCEFFQLPDGGTDLQALTVGGKFGMKCHGDIAVAWDQSADHLAFAKPEDQYTLSILKTVQQDPTSAQYVVTSYKAGKHQLEYIRVLQGSTGSEKGFEFSKPNWQVQSVLDPKQPPQPYGPFGPWQLSLPTWFLVALALVLVAIVLLIVRRVRRHAQRRRMLENLKLYATVLSPLHQFYRDARQLRRRLHGAKEPEDLKAITTDLDRDFRLFVLRRFEIPALEWSNRAILEDLRRRHRKTYRTASESLKKTLRELGKLKARPHVGAADVEQMHSMSLDAAEKLENLGGQP